MSTPSTSYVPPVGNQVLAEQATSAAAKTLQAQQGVQLTTYTWVQATEGTGVAQFTVDFDVAFTAEPVVGHGIVMLGATAAATADATSAQGGAIPLSNVLIKQWLTNDQGHYVGAVCLAIMVIPCSCEKAAPTPVDPPPSDPPAEAS